MSDKEKIEKWLKEHDGEDYCNYCHWESNCCKRMSGSPNGPIETPCISRDVNDFLDMDALLEDMEEERAEEVGK